MWMGLGAAALAGPPALVSVESDRVEMDVRMLASSPEGGIAAASKDAVQRLGVEADPIELESADIRAVDLSADGWLAIASNGSVTVHDPDGRETLRLGGTGDLAGIALSPDATRLALASPAGIALHDAAGGRILWTVEGQAAGVTFHPDGKRIVAGVAGGNVVLSVANGKEQKRFGDAPAVWFAWTDAHLWTRPYQEGPEAWDPVTFEPAPAPPVEGTVTSVAVHPAQEWVVADGCVAGTELCPVQGATAARFDAAGALWLAGGGTLSRWTVPDQAVRLLGEASDRPLVTGLVADEQDWVVTRIDGVLRRLGPDGSTRFEVKVPGCGERDCVPIAVGGAAGGAWVIGPTGLAFQWGADGTPLDKKPRATEAVSAGRLADGRWVVLGSDGRARVGTKPGKGPATDAVPNARAVSVGGFAFAVLGDVVQPFDAEGEPLASPNLGPGRVALAAAVSPDGEALALIDDEGSLHCYTMADARPRFRQPHGLQTEGASLAWTADGARIVTGGERLQVFSATDGKPVLDAVLAPGGHARRLAPGTDGVGLVQGDADAEQVLVLDVDALAP